MATAKTNSKFMAPMTPDTILSDIIGNKPVPRTEIVKKLWVYIKKYNLQDKKNKRNINADEKLLKFFGGKKQVTMFELAKFIGKHAK
ncbi:MAG: SWIB/MDM2 domain-containing protein [Elusimicrobia bacterium]|nr:SWIB/MDM2 domain-containing protein [Elusimicrobiota bacterium]